MRVIGVIMAVLFLYFLVKLSVAFWNDVYGEGLKYSQGTVSPFKSMLFLTFNMSFIGDIEFQIMRCTKEYEDNRCATSMIPALVERCLNWRRCMNADPSLVARTRIITRLFSQLLDEFIENLSIKTLVSGQCQSKWFINSSRD